MIPGFLIALVTFPGIMLHEFAHKKFCDWFDVKVLKVNYFDFKGGGYVIHEKAESFKAIFWISVGPLIINSLSTFSLAFFAGAYLKNSNELFLFVLWLALSFGAHSFPSNQDVKNILHESKRRIKDGGHFFHYLSYPFVGLIYVVNLLRFFWIDFIWAGFIILLALGLAGGNLTQEINSFFQSESGDEVFEVGDYSCSTFHGNKVDELYPENVDGQLVDRLEEDIEEKEINLNHLEVEIENLYVDENSQFSIDAYNLNVDLYNEKLEEFEEDYSYYKLKLEEHNDKFVVYDKYLKENCEEIK